MTDDSDNSHYLRARDCAVDGAAADNEGDDDGCGDGCTSTTHRCSLWHLCRGAAESDQDHTLHCNRDAFCDTSLLACRPERWWCCCRQHCHQFGFLLWRS